MTALGLPTNGRKADLKARLEAHKNGENGDAVPKPLSARDQVTVTQAQAAVDKAAKQAAKAASEETENRTKALRFQDDQLRKNSNSFDPRTDSRRPERKPVINSEKPAVRLGEYVSVMAALGINGPARHGGEGWVIDTAGTLLATAAPPS